MAACARPPNRAISSRALARASAPRAQIDTPAPASANASAIARPIPLLPPATTARCPARSMSITPPLSGLAHSHWVPPPCRQWNGLGLAPSPPWKSQRSTAEAALTLLERPDRTQEIDLAQRRPQHVGEIELAVGTLP